MTTYPGATTIVRTQVLFGQQEEVADTDIVRHVLSEEAFDLEDRVNVIMALITTHSGRLATIALGGSGDGNVFSVAMIETSQSSPGLPGLPPSTANSGTKVFFYKAETPAELAVQYAACKARITAWLAEGLGWTGQYFDYQIAGGGHGGPVMGMIVVYRYSQL